MLLENKRGLIVGVANHRSFAWGIARSAAREGAALALSFQNERLQRNVDKLAAQIPGTLTLPLDVSSEEQLATAAETVRAHFGGLDFLVHAVAYALREDLEGDFVSTSREGFRVAHDISVYSLTALVRHFTPLLEADGGGAALTLSYLGGERAVPHYNVMGVAKAALESSVRYLASDLGPRGVRVNAISAGPAKTLAASGVSGIGKMVEHYREHAPLRAGTDPLEVGDAAAFLLSDAARGVTGEVLHVDSGFHALGATIPGLGAAG